jgi:SAM-dependent methyltransferase
MKPLSQHNKEIHSNAHGWKDKELLRIIYSRFYREIATALRSTDGTGILEIGSGIGAIKSVLPHCVTSDIFPNEWLDRTENAYALSFGDNSLDGIVLFDVFHHLQYPGLALKEFLRVLKPEGRVVLFEPAMGWMGRLVYGLFHHEPLGFGNEIQWEPPPGEKPTLSYYAAQANCWRLFQRQEIAPFGLSGFAVSGVKLSSAFSYVASGGFSKPQLYPGFLYRPLLSLENHLDKLPQLFATRMLVTLVKTFKETPGCEL